MASQSGTSSDPFTVTVVSNLSLGSKGHSLGVQRLICPRQRPFGPGRQGRHPAGYPATSGWSSGTIVVGSRPLSEHRHALLEHPVPPRHSAPLTIGLPGRPGPDLDGVSTFRAHEMRPGWAPPNPRGQRCSHNRRIRLRSPLAASARPVHLVFVIEQDAGPQVRVLGQSRRAVGRDGLERIQHRARPHPC